MSEEVARAVIAAVAAIGGTCLTLAAAIVRNWWQHQRAGALNRGSIGSSNAEQLWHLLMADNKDLRDRVEHLENIHVSDAQRMDILTDEVRKCHEERDRDRRRHRRMLEALTKDDEVTHELPVEQEV